MKISSKKNLILAIFAFYICGLIGSYISHLIMSDQFLNQETLLASPILNAIIYPIMSLFMIPLHISGLFDESLRVMSMQLLSLNTLVLFLIWLAYKNRGSPSFLYYYLLACLVFHAVGYVYLVGSTSV